MRAIDQCLIGLDHPFVLTHLRFLHVNLLFGDRILGQEAAITLQIKPRIGEQRLIPRQLPGNLVELRLERTWIDFRQHLPGLDPFSFAEIDPHQLPIDPGLDRHRIAGRDRPQSRQRDIDIARLHDHRLHRKRPARTRFASGCRRFSHRTLPSPVPCPTEQQQTD